MKTFDPTKPVQCRDGRKVRILAADLQEPDWPIAAAVTGTDGCETVFTYSKHGHYMDHGETCDDLINIPERRVVDVWVNVYAVPENDTIHETAMGANEASLPDRLTCIHKQIEIEVP